MPERPSSPRTCRRRGCRKRRAGPKAFGHEEIGIAVAVDVSRGDTRRRNPSVADVARPAFSVTSVKRPCPSPRRGSTARRRRRTGPRTRRGRSRERPRPEPGQMSAIRRLVSLNGGSWRGAPSPASAVAFMKARIRLHPVPQRGLKLKRVLAALFGHDRARRTLDPRTVRAESSDGEYDPACRLLAVLPDLVPRLLDAVVDVTRAGRGPPMPMRAARRSLPGPTPPPRGCAAPVAPPRSRPAISRAGPSTAGTPPRRRSMDPFR